ncbi:hypothetical protein Cgig2_023825 [Carnegiea gigantea]|uniref:Uncharacterized protein n=1 Tax=Carnegiea gigantea TaxID=171969 RepID=A0A9Q1K7K1_9CARY|nr:hypothetical protein Cgig2_023825 [Carnegiea gigantea]
MSTITDTITRQVSEQVKRAMEAANSTKPFLHFDYVSTNGCKPSHQQERVPSLRYTEWERESGHTTTECRELKKALHELADKGQIGRFLKRGPRFLRREQEAAQLQPREEEYSTEVVATIARGYADGMTRSAWKAQLRSAQQVLTIEQGSSITLPTMVFGGKEAPRFASPYNDPLVVEMKIASAIVRSVDIITWDCLKKLTHPGRDIVPLVYPILGFSEQEVNPTGMIHLPVCFIDKLKAKNLGVDFLVVNVPTAYNVILGHPTLHKLSTILTILIIRSPGISIQGVSCLIPCTITLAGRRNKLHLVEVAALILSLLMLVDVVEVGLVVAILLKFVGQLHQELVQIPQGIGKALLIALLPGLSHHFGPAPLAPGRQSPQLRHSTTALTPRANAYAIVTSSSVILGGSKVPEVTKSQDLTKSWISENLTTGSALIKLVDGRWALGGEPPMSPRSWGGGVLLTIGGAVPSSPTSRVPRGKPFDSHFAHMGRGRRRGLIRTTLDPLMLVDCIRWGAYGQNNLSVYSKLGVTMKGANKVLKCTFLACWFTRRYLSSSQRRSVSAATCLGVVSRVSKTINLAPHLLYIKQKGSQKFLRIERPLAARKKSFLKNFNLGSQFKGSLSLDLLLFLSGPFTDSIA